MANIHKRIADCTYAEIQKWSLGNDLQNFRVPTLSEVLQTFPQVLKNIDIKISSPEIVKLTVELINKYQAQEHVLLTSEHARNIKHIKKMGYEACLGSSKSDVAKILLYTHLKFCRPKRKAGDRVQVPVSIGAFEFASEKFIESCHELSLLVDFWVINSVSEAKHLLELGADGIMTDDPALLKPIFDKL